MKTLTAKTDTTTAMIDSAAILGLAIARKHKNDTDIANGNCANDWREWALTIANESLPTMNAILKAMRSACHDEKEVKVLQNNLTRYTRKAVYTASVELDIKPVYLWACKGAKLGLQFTHAPMVTTAKPQKDAKQLSAKTSSNMGSDTITQEEKSTFEKAILLESIPTMAPLEQIAAWHASGVISLSDIGSLYIDLKAQAEKAGAIAKKAQSSKNSERKAKELVRKAKTTPPTVMSLAMDTAKQAQAKKEKEQTRKDNARKIEQPIVDQLAFGG